MKVMYLDEAGNHALSVIEPNFPVFVLAGVIVDRQYALEVVEPKINELKMTYLGRDDFVLHTVEIVRNRGPFAPLKDAGLKYEFVSALTALMRELDYLVVSCAIRKHQYVAMSQEDTDDLYPRTLETVIEQFCAEIGDEPNSGMIYAERRRPDLDVELELSWRRICRIGSGRLDAGIVTGRILELVLKDKRALIGGLQLADLVVSPIGRALSGYPKREDWGVIESKFRRVEGSYLGVGLTVLPE